MPSPFADPAPDAVVLDVFWPDVIDAPGSNAGYGDFDVDGPAALPVTPVDDCFTRSGVRGAVEVAGFVVARAILVAPLSVVFVCAALGCTRGGDAILGGLWFVQRRLRERRGLASCGRVWRRGRETRGIIVVGVAADVPPSGIRGSEAGGGGGENICQGTYQSRRLPLARYI